jgi:hypothetical protein
MHHFGLFRQTLVLAACGFLLPALMAQADMVSAGGNGASAGNSVSFTLGQSFAAVSDTEDGSVYQGVQQPYELFAVSIERDASSKLQVRLFPNPASDRLLLELAGVETPLGLQYTLYDLQGRQLDERTLAGPLTEISLGYQPPGAYLLRLRQGDHLIETFRIIKQ